MDPHLHVLWVMTRGQTAENSGFDFRKLLTRDNVLAAVYAFSALVLICGLFYYYSLAKKVDARLSSGAFADAANIYGTTLTLDKGDIYSPQELRDALEQAGYQVHAEAGEATISREQDAGTTVRISFGSSHQISRILVNGSPQDYWNAGYPLIANLSAGHEERRPVTYGEIPPVLVHAVLAAEDKRFFHHRGLDLERMAKACYVDLHSRRKAQGASTLTMQLVRGLWLDPDKSWRRKVSEIMMTVHLENRLSKEEIFADYANQVYLGRQAAWNIHGFAEGARVYFAEDLDSLTLPQAALLAGMVQRPSYFNPVHYPGRALRRRNLVLAMMKANAYISQDDYSNAVIAPLGLHSESQRDPSAGSPYYLDLINTDPNEESPREIYTTIDPRLQRAASEAVEAGMREVDQRLAGVYAKTGKRAQAALIALDPHTGEIRALVGGRNYGQSQLNHILADRPPGSVFKPFVYAAAINSRLLTEASMIDDSPSSFWWNGKAYSPGNFRDESYGMLSLRDALAKSDNVAAVKVAETTGLNRVVEMARSAGLNDRIHATPAVALGSYAVTPLEIAGAYTPFANGGMWVKPHLVSEVRNANGQTISDQSESRQAMDPRVAAVMLDMLQEVVRSGTAAGIRGRGFMLPAAGKTGTSHDGWFAGFTTQLLCIVWVGFDDHSELNLEGAKSALPIWTLFMKKAAQYSPYRRAGTFPDSGLLEKATICTQSGKLAGDQCPQTREAVFLPGTAPQEKCDQHGTPAVGDPEISDIAIDKAVEISGQP